MLNQFIIYYNPNPPSLIVILLGVIGFAIYFFLGRFIRNRKDTIFGVLLILVLISVIYEWVFKQ